MYVLTGSKAMNFWYPSQRAGKDWDYLTSDPDRVRLGGEDIFSHPSIADWDWAVFGVASPEELYTIKVSHSYWEVGGTWNKHMSDIHFFQNTGVKFLPELHDLLKPLWQELHGKKKTNLNQNAKNFFGDAVVRKYDHDSVHDSIAYGERPLYEEILIPGEEVMVNSDKFFNEMDHETQLKLVREEVYATALERIMIPNDYTGSAGLAYRWALRRTITSLFKGRWATWAVLNYSDLSKPDCDYVQRHLDNKDRLILL